MTYYEDTTVEVNGEETHVRVEITWVKEGGRWFCTRLNVLLTDPRLASDGELVGLAGGYLALSDDLADDLRERFHPSVMPDPRDVA